MEQAQQEKVYMERLPLVAMQIRSALGNIYYGMQKLAPPMNGTRIRYWTRTPPCSTMAISGCCGWQRT